MGSTKGRNKPTLFKIYETRSYNGIEKPYIRLTGSLNYSEAMKDLSNLEYRVFIDMKFAAKGNDEVIYTQKMAMDATGCCKQSYKTTMDKLGKVGLIERIPVSAYSASKYRFSSKWKDYKSQNRDILTDKRIKQKKRTYFQPND